jgi:hypothetical protein
MLEEIEEVAKDPGIFKYHKDLGAVLFDKEEAATLDPKEWFDTPAFDVAEPVKKKFISKKPLEKMSKIELVQAGLSIDLKKEEITGLTKEELIALLK